MYCKNCGNQVEGNATFCNNCGANNKFAQEQRNTNVLALMGFISSCISLLLNFWGIIGIVSVILSLVGLIQIRKSGEKGKGLAIAGIVIGAFSIVWSYIVIFISIFSYMLI